MAGRAISFATPDQRSDVRSIERLIRKALPVSKPVLSEKAIPKHDDHQSRPFQGRKPNPHERNRKPRFEHRNNNPRRPGIPKDQKGSFFKRA